MAERTRHPVKRRATDPKKLRQNPDALTWARTRTGLTQKQLAELVGISPAHLANIERGDRGASAAVLIRLAEAINCPVSVLEAKYEPAGRAA